MISILVRYLISIRKSNIVNEIGNKNKVNDIKSQANSQIKLDKYQNIVKSNILDKS